MNIKRYKHPKVCLCQRCKGSGEISAYNAKGEHEKQTQCPNCLGSGRVIVSAVMDITISPYNPQNDTKEQSNDLPKTR